MFKRKVWYYDRANSEELNRLIDTENWDFIDSTDIDDACERFTFKLSVIMSRCIPSKEVTIRPNDRPWYDSKIRRFSRHRDRLKKLVIKHGRQTDWIKYKMIRNKVNNFIKEAKQRYLTNIDETLSNSRNECPKTFWKHIRTLVNRNKKCDTLPILRTTENGHEYFHCTDEKKAECLNLFFSSISTVNDTNANLPPFVSITNIRLTHIAISAEEIVNIISNLNTNKAVGPDLISHKLLKMAKYNISKPLTKLFNKSLTDTKFPCKWKECIVNPLFKKGDKSSVSNYRPISLLSCLGKLMERCVYKHVYNYFFSNRLIYEKQSGFLKGHSTVHQLLEIYHQVVSSLDAKQSTCMAFCDISKAFDRVWYKGLIFKLRQLGISDSLLDWFSDYLSSRKQSVMVKTARSRSRPINAGVP